MKRFLKTACIAALLCALFVCTAAAANKYPTQTNRFFVNDFAGVISNTDADTMYNLGKNLDAACGAQVVVVTVDSLDGTPIEDYAYTLANEWQLGDKEKDNGVLLLLAVSDREVRIEVGSGLEGALPDSKTGRILDRYGIDYFAVDEFSVGLTSVYTSIYNEVCIEYGVQPQEGYEPVEEEDFSVLDIAEFVVLIIVFIIIFSNRRRFARRGFWIWPGGFHGGGGFGGHSGGFGGGSGGFGGFSGGGGGFSGGGASRKF